MSRRTLSLAVKPAQGTPVDDVIERICVNCRFFNVEATTCQRKPPYIDLQEGVAIWPAVDPTDWCGEFKRLPLERS